MKLLAFAIVFKFVEVGFFLCVFFLLFFVVVIASIQELLWLLSCFVPAVPINMTGNLETHCSYRAT